MEDFKNTPRSLSYRGEALEQIPLTGTTSVPEGGAHPQKRRSGSLIRVLAVLLFAAALAGAYLAAPVVTGLDYVRIHRLEMKGDTAKVPLPRLKEVVEPELEGKSYFTTDIAAVRAAAETVPWVKHASVRRIWPDRIEIDITVYEAAAQLEDGRLISIEGKLFSANPEEGAEARNLPTFSCAAEAVPELLRRYRRFTSLFGDLPFRITALSLSDRGSWSLVIQGPRIPPTRVELGRDTAGSPVEERVRQVAAAYPRMEELLGGPPSSIDARYRRAIAAGKVDKKALEAYLEENARAEEKKESAALPAENPAQSPEAPQAQEAPQAGPDALSPDNDQESASDADDSADSTELEAQENTPTERSEVSHEAAEGK